MKARPVFSKELGAFFRRVRESRGYGLREAASLAHRRGLKGITNSVLTRLETGQTKTPEPELLHALAVLYRVPYAVLVEQFVRVRYGVTSSDQAGTENASSNDQLSEGTTVVSTTPRTLTTESAHIPEPSPDDLDAAVRLITAASDMFDLANKFLGGYAGAPVPTPAKRQDHADRSRQTPARRRRASGR